MREEPKNDVHISHIKNGEIKAQELHKSSSIVKATLSEKKNTGHTVLMKEDLFRKLEEQREKIKEETKRAEESKEAWIKHLEEEKQRKNRQEEGTYETEAGNDDHVGKSDDDQWMYRK